MRQSGLIRSWNDARGFGFIAPADGTDDVFVHISALVPGYPRPQAGQAVSFETTRQEGRTRARLVMLENVVRSRPRPRPAPAPAPAAAQPAQTDGARTGPPASGVWVLPAFVGLCILLVLFWHPPRVLIPLYFAASATSLALYALDKRAARQGRRRVPEATLHGVDLLGGWPGALVAQQWFRHKTSKRSFRTVYWVTVVLNVSVLVWSASPHAAALLNPG